MDVSKGLYVRIKRMDGCILYAHGRNLGQNVKIQRYPKAQLFFNSKSDQYIVKNMFQKNFYLGNVALDLQGSGNNPAEWFFSLSFWFVGSNFYLILENPFFPINHLSLENLVDKQRIWGAKIILSLNKMVQYLF